ncbi:hypothetical protein WG66_010095, partial [Moniliophthora roreri]
KLKTGRKIEEDNDYTKVFVLQRVPSADGKLLPNKALQIFLPRLEEFIQAVQTGHLAVTQTETASWGPQRKTLMLHSVPAYCSSQGTRDIVSPRRLIYPATWGEAGLAAGMGYR